LLTNAWLREVVRYTHPDKCHRTLRQLDVGRELIDAAKDAITEFTKKVLELYQTVDEVVASNKGALIEGNIRCTMSDVFTELVPRMAQWDRDMKEARKPIDCKRHRQEGDLKRYARFVNCITWEQYLELYLKGTDKKTSRACENRDLLSSQD
jgi:hypothetical protein